MSRDWVDHVEACIKEVRPAEHRAWWATGALPETSDRAPESLSRPTRGYHSQACPVTSTIWSKSLHLAQVVPFATHRRRRV
jgi:hypothetical protein